MSEMVERVAKAMDEAGLAYLDSSKNAATTWDDVPSAVLARAAIEAMREPTGGMSFAGVTSINVDSNVDLGIVGHEETCAAYRAMIDAAIS